MSLSDVLLAAGFCVAGLLVVGLLLVVWFLTDWVVFCNDYRSSKFTNVSPNLRKKSELLYYNDENLMFASLASNRRQTAFWLRADLLDRLAAVFDEPNDETLAAMKEADNLTMVDMSNCESFLKSLE